MGVGQMFTKISKENVLAFLRSVAVMSIAVTDGDKPISSVVTFAVDSDLSFYFLTKRDTYKAKALMKNQKISICVWEHGRMLVQMSGLAHEIDHEPEHKEALLKIQKASSVIPNFWWPIMHISKGEYAVYKISTEWLRVLDLSGKNIKEEGDPFFNIQTGLSS